MNQIERNQSNEDVGATVNFADDVSDQMLLRAAGTDAGGLGAQPYPQRAFIRPTSFPSSDGRFCL